jgi:hypothetical protein
MSVIVVRLHMREIASLSTTLCGQDGGSNSLAGLLDGGGDERLGDPGLLVWPHRLRAQPSRHAAQQVLLSPATQVVFSLVTANSDQPIRDPRSLPLRWPAKLN